MRRAKPKTGPKLDRWQEAAVYGLLGGLAVTGFAWLLLHQFVTVEGEFGPGKHPAEHVLIVAHGALSFVFLVFAGMILEGHVPSAWSRRRNLYTGIGLLSALGLAALTALGLYYVADERLRGWTSVAHWSVGAAALAVLVPHAIRRGRNSSARRSIPQPNELPG